MSEYVIACHGMSSMLSLHSSERLSNGFERVERNGSGEKEENEEGENSESPGSGLVGFEKCISKTFHSILSVLTSSIAELQGVKVRISMHILCL